MTPPAPAATPAKGPSGSLQKYNGEWRTSQLIGATVYSSNGDSLGTVSDLLTGDNGQIDQVVISTGGVLGIGGRMVEVPLNQLKFEPSAENNAAPQAAATPNATLNKPAGNGGPIGGGAATTSAAAPPASHPTYYSIVLPNATKDTLAKMQAFKFASTG